MSHDFEKSLNERFKVVNEIYDHLSAHIRDNPGLYTEGERQGVYFSYYLAGKKFAITAEYGSADTYFLTASLKRPVHNFSFEEMVNIPELEMIGIDGAHFSMNGGILKVPLYFRRVLEYMQSNLRPSTKEQNN